jgi:hypothetical protein
MTRYNFLIVTIPFLFLFLIIPFNVFGFEDLDNYTSFDPFLGFDGRFEGKSVGHFEYEKNCSNNDDDWGLCKVVIDNEILLRGNLINTDKNSLISNNIYIPTPTGSAWGACFGTIKYYDIKDDIKDEKLLGSYPFSAPIVFGPADFGISSSGTISIPENFGNVSIGFSTSDPIMKQCIGEIRGISDLRTIDKNIYSSRASGIIEKTNGHIEYNWILTLLHPNSKIKISNNSLPPKNKIDNEIALIFQTSEDPIPNRKPQPIVEVKPSNNVASNTRVILDGSKSKDPDPGDNVIKWEWRSVGNDIVLSSTTSSIVEFTAPTVTQSTIFTFSLTVFDTLLQKSNDLLIHVTVNPNRPPIAEGSWIATPPSPPNKAFINTQIKLDGSASFDPDESGGDDVIKWEWKKISPSDDYVPNTLTNPNSEIATFQLPDYIPMKSSGLTFPTPMPIEFSLVVEDKHQTKSTNTEIITVNAECVDFMQRTAENTRNNLFLRLINHDFAFLVPQTVNNFQYFLMGKGDTVGMLEGVSGKGNPKPLPIDWLENEPKAFQYNLAQEKLLKEIQQDLRNLLNTMKNGETKTLPLTKPYTERILTPGFSVNPRVVDFANSVGQANLELIPHLTITKNRFLPDVITGEIKLLLKDTYDFNINDVVRLPRVLGGDTYTAFDLHSVIRCLGARNFDQTTTFDKIITDMPLNIFRSASIECDSEFCKIPN